MAFDLITVAASSARTANGNSGAVGPNTAQVLEIGVVVSAASGTTPSCAFSVEWSFDGVNFGAGESPVTFAAITAAKNTGLRTTMQAPYFRLVWTITGTTPSFTFTSTARIY